MMKGNCKSKDKVRQTSKLNQSKYCQLRNVHKDLQKSHLKKGLFWAKMNKPLRNEYERLAADVILV